MTAPSPDIDAILRESRHVAVLGASDKPERAGHYVPAYLAAHGYRITAINPMLAGQALFGAPVVAALADVTEAVDVVDVFRRGADMPGHLPEILAMSPPPKVVWLQLGVGAEAVADALEAAGITVVRERCMLEEHRRRG